MAMTITVTKKPALARVEAVVTGEIDGKTAPDIQAQLVGLAETHCRLFLDMKAVSFLSSAGLRMLLLLYRHFAASSGEIILVGVTEEIRDTMSMTGFSNFFKFADSLDEASGS
jgi:anti-sigma B factor antagonist